MFDNELFNSSKFSLSETLKENANSIKTPNNRADLDK